MLIGPPGVPSAKIRVIPNGVAADRCPVPDAPRIARGPPAFRPPRRRRVVAYLGSLTAEKQVDAAIAAVARLPGVHLLVAGNGPERAALEAQAARDAPSRVRFVGALPDVAPVLAAADAVVLASRTEGMPGVLIEAGLSDRPVVAFDVGAVSEVVADGETGVLVAAGRRRRPGGGAPAGARRRRARWAPPPVSGASPGSRSASSAPAGPSWSPSWRRELTVGRREHGRLTLRRCGGPSRTRVVGRRDGVRIGFDVRMGTRSAC